MPKCSCNIKPCSKEQNRKFKKQQSLNLLHRPSPPFLFRGDPASGRASGKARLFCCACAFAKILAGFPRVHRSFPVPSAGNGRERTQGTLLPLRGTGLAKHPFTPSEHRPAYKPPQPDHARGCGPLTLGKFKRLLPYKAPEF